MIDGTGLAYRSYYAFIRNPLKNSSGEETSAIFGCTNTIFKLLREYNPEYMCVVFDVPGPTERHIEFTGYKAQRPVMPQELERQLPWIKEIVQALGLKCLEKEGYEADDVITTAAKIAEKNRFKIIIVSSDKDFLQLVDEQICVLKPSIGKGEEILFDVPKVLEKYGILPQQIPEFLGLAGDVSDNIPGVSGIGYKSSLQLIRQFETIDGIFGSLDRIRQKRLKEKLKQFKEQAFLSRDLVRLRGDVPIEINVEDFHVGPRQHGRLYELFKKFEFTRFLTEIDSEEIKIENEKNYNLVCNEDVLNNLVEKIKEKECVSIDIETTSLNPMQAGIVGISISPMAAEAWYIPLLHQNTKNFSLEIIKKTVGEVFADEDIKKIGQNIKYDLTVLKENGLELRGIWFDTMIASYLLDPSRRMHNLGSLVFDFLNHKMVSYKELIDGENKQIGFNEIPIDKAVAYSCEDADYTFRLKEIFLPQLISQGLWSLFEKVEMPLIYVLSDMERTGMKIDFSVFSGISKEIEHNLENLKREIFNLAGVEFNINSPKQVGEIIFEKLKLGKGRKTKTGYSTDVEVLQKLAKNHIFPQKLLDYRQLYKLKSTYVDAIPKMINCKTGRIHTSFNQTVTETGRLSSSEPNLQNIPMKNEFAREIRKGFVSRDDFLLLSADYSQIELRIVAHLSEDDELRRAFWNDEDIHATTASLVFQKDISDITKDLRRRAKAINFGIIYGMGPHGLAQELEISQEEAEKFIENYFVRFPKVKEWISHTLEETRDKGYITTLLSRRRYLPDIFSDVPSRRAYAERVAINTIVQGTAADIIKVAMNNIWKKIQDERLISRMILQVHDELLFEVPLFEKERLTNIVKYEMENSFSLSVPILITIACGKNWYEAHP